MVPVSGLLGWAVAAGVALGLGGWSLLSLVPRLARPTLTERLAPYLTDVSESARGMATRTAIDPLPVYAAFLRPVLALIGSVLGRLFGGPERTARRLRQAGSSLTVERYRAEQLLWLAGGLVVGAVLTVLLSQARTVTAGASLLVVPLAAGAAVAFRDWLLSRQTRQRLAQISAELPTLLEFLTLSLSAGEGIFDSVSRVARISSGQLSRELGFVVAEVHAGISFPDALTGLARELQLPALARAVDQIVAALEHGSPLAEVLRAQAQDSRDEARRDLLEAAGKKEVTMLVPLVFLILPTTIAFAIFPGILVLQTGF